MKSILKILAFTVRMNKRFLDLSACRHDLQIELVKNEKERRIDIFRGDLKITDRLSLTRFASWTSIFI